ncbi:hypothetical protein AVEN_74488-1 [Araneus ventricosus]|uniref:Uncharacterized protein n=1 Tax=Araneus ventricosus TaxID=182803 RepID=A0A4Y1ZPY0_ARAVE|nr:hypothetical protein AVEN_74488-1 [Araneus ventricosus]
MFLIIPIAVSSREWMEPMTSPTQNFRGTIHLWSMSLTLIRLYWYMGRINQCYLWAVLSTSSTGGASAYFGNYHATTFAGNSLFSNLTAKRGEELTWIKMASCPMFTNCCSCGALILLKITNFKSTQEPSAGMRNCPEDCLNFGVVRF